MMPRQMLIIAGLCFTTVSASINDHGQPFVQTVTSSELATAGVTRIADILLLSDLWDRVTTDGINWFSVANGLGTLQQQHFHIFLDGQKLDANLFDALNINLLGLTLEQIDSVHIGSSPALINGEFTSGGYIHFFTSRNGDGWKFTGSVELGNETGDPGPYTYTDHATSNVDRVGNTKTFAVEHHQSNKHYIASNIVQEHSFTDLAMFGRTRAHSVMFPWVYNITPALLISRYLAGGWQNIRATYSSSDNFYTFSQPLGFETPVHLKFATAGMDGHVRQSDNIAWNYRWIYSSHNLGKLPNTLDFEYDYRLDHLSGNTELAAKYQSADLKIGLGIDRYKLTTAAKLSDDSYAVIKAYASAGRTIAPGLVINLHALVSAFEERVSGDIITSGSWQPNGNHRLNVTYSLINRRHALENPQLIWLTRGYDLYEWSNSGDGVSDKLSSHHQTVDIDWRYNISPRVAANIGISYRQVKNLTLEDRQIGYNSSNFRFPTVNTLSGDQRYNVVGVHFGGSGQLSPTLKWHLSSRLWSIVDATASIRAEWEKIPAHQFKAKMTWTPVSRFAIWLMMTRVPSTYWAEYEAIDGALYPWGSPRGKYEATVPGWTRVDIQIRKQMWHERFILFLLMRNILDEEVRYHPIGATFHMTLHLKGEIALSRPQ